MIQLTVIAFIACGLVVMVKGKVKPNVKGAVKTAGQASVLGGILAVACLPTILCVCFWAAVIKFLFF